ncbi:MAG: hypothetical protein LHW60_02290 [Candidatus Cloacimonetes bacterium]|jgi:predicted Zn-ribbon and HTH transcriptional regulator|nr:hypothetical protein [Candidatus Cloacimonadota bacterium]
MEALLIIIIIVVVVYFFKKKNSRSSLKEQNKRKTSTSNVSATVRIDNDAYSTDNSSSVAYNLYNIYTITKGYGPYYTGESALEAITRDLLEIRKYLDKKYIFKSDEYDAIISKYNQVANHYKYSKKRLLEDIMALSTSPDMQHCPSCLEDIGKEVTRARMCPKCKEKIIIFRDIPEMRFLVNETQLAKISEMWKSVELFEIPNLLLAFEYSKVVRDKLLILINDFEEQEKLRKEAKNLTIDF